MAQYVLVVIEMKSFRDGSTTPGGGFQHGSIGAPNLVRQRLRSNVNQLIACADDGQTDGPRNGQRGRSDGGGDSNFGWADAGARGQQQVALALVGGASVHVLTGALGQYLNAGYTLSIKCLKRHILVPNYCIGTWRQHSACHDFDSRARILQWLRRDSGKLSSFDGEVNLPSSYCFKRQGYAVHRHAVERRKVAVSS
jgi:hypothetical protein